MADRHDPGCEVRPVAGYEGLYSVSADGRVWSHARLKHGGCWLRQGRTLGGYRMVNLYDAERRKKPSSVHRLVAVAWVSNPDPTKKAHVNHIDSDRANNRATNLEWCTRSENLTHAYTLGLRAYPGKLSDEQVRRARDARAGGMTYRQVAALVGCNEEAARSLARGKTYRHVL